MKMCYQFLLFLVFVLVCTSFLACDGVPADAKGYDKVKWGASPEKVRKIYELSDDIQITHAENDSDNTGRLVQENVSDSMTKRTFIFGNNKLYRVYVFYTNNINPDDISTALAEKYGTVSDTKVDTQTQTKNNPQYGLSQTGPSFGNNGRSYNSWQFTQTGNTVTTTTTTNYKKVFSQYSPKTEVEFWYGQTWQPQVCYTWKEYRDEFLSLTEQKKTWNYRRITI